MENQPQVSNPVPEKEETKPRKPQVICALERTIDETLTEKQIIEDIRETIEEEKKTGSKDKNRAMGQPFLYFKLRIEARKQFFEYYVPQGMIKSALIKIEKHKTLEIKTLVQCQYIEHDGRIERTSIESTQLKRDAARPGYPKRKKPLTPKTKPTKVQETGEKYGFDNLNP